MVTPERKFEAGSGYRYGFNGKENDKDISEGGQDYGMRIYDSRLGRFLSADPISKDYAMLTPYQFSSNSRISGIDLDGLEYYFAANGSLIAKFGNSTEVRIVTDEKVIESINADVKQGLNSKEKLYNSNLLGNQTVIKETLSVNDRTNRNGGYREESSLVNSDNTIDRGITGPLPEYKKNTNGDAIESEAPSTLPKPTNQMTEHQATDPRSTGIQISQSYVNYVRAFNRSKAVIHSHTNKTHAEFKDGDNKTANYWPFTTAISNVDNSTFLTRNSEFFIITGQLNPPTVSIINGRIDIQDGTLGATYYNQNGTKQFDIKINILKKIDSTLDKEAEKKPSN